MILCGKMGLKVGKEISCSFAGFRKKQQQKSLLKPGCQALFNLRCTSLTLICLGLPVSQASRSTDISGTHPLYEKYSYFFFFQDGFKNLFSKALTYL